MIVTSVFVVTLYSLGTACREAKVKRTLQAKDCDRACDHFREVSTCANTRFLYLFSESSISEEKGTRQDETIGELRKRCTALDNKADCKCTCR